MRAQQKLQSLKSPNGIEGKNYWFFATNFNGINHARRMSGCSLNEVDAFEQKTGYVTHIKLHAHIQIALRSMRNVEIRFHCFCDQTKLKCHQQIKLSSTKRCSERNIQRKWQLCQLNNSITFTEYQKSYKPISNNSFIPLS